MLGILGDPVWKGQLKIHVKRHALSAALVFLSTSCHADDTWLCRGKIQSTRVNVSHAFVARFTWLKIGGAAQTSDGEALVAEATSEIAGAHGAQPSLPPAGSFYADLGLPLPDRPALPRFDPSAATIVSVNYSIFHPALVPLAFRHSPSKVTWQMLSPLNLVPNFGVWTEARSTGESTSIEGTWTFKPEHYLTYSYISATRKVRVTSSFGKSVSLVADARLKENFNQTYLDQGRAFEKVTAEAPQDEGLETHLDCSVQSPSHPSSL